MTRQKPIRPLWPPAALALAALLVTGPAWAQRSPGTAVEVVEAFLQATWSWKWSEAARYLHLPDMEAIRQEALMNYTRPYPLRTVEQALKEEPDLPRAVAEYQVARFNDLVTNQPHPLFREFPTVATREGFV